jgi:hypothetical protein
LVGKRVPNIHRNGAEFNEAIDAYNGQKHKVMKELGEYLTKPGTPSKEILELLGNPNETTSDSQGVLMMPGPYVGEGGIDAQASNPQKGTMKLIYYWRGRHDYLWFGVDPDTSLVTSGGWYHALE